MLSLVVINIQDLLNTIIPHFMNYPLLSQKLADFELFVKIVKLLNEGAQFNSLGLQKIINIKASLNKGSSDFIKSHFSSINPGTRQII